MNISTIKLIQSFVLLILLINQFTPSSSTTTTEFNTTSSNGLLVPVGEIEYHYFEANSMENQRRRRLAPFQLCLSCKCCASGGGSSIACASMPCCFGIDCQLPNKPFGVCAFVPKTCNCTSCAL